MLHSWRHLSFIKGGILCLSLFILLTSLEYVAGRSWSPGCLAVQT